MALEAIISPHLDDAALSCWHRAERANEQIVTLFAGVPKNTMPSFWDSFTGFTGSAEAMRTRILENDTALSPAAIPYVNLPYLDRSYTARRRNIPEMASVVSEVTSPEATFMVAAGLSSFWIRRHPDHATTRKVGLALQERGRQVAFYADIPYAIPGFNLDDWPLKLPKERIKRLLKNEVQIEPTELSSAEQKRKQAAVRAYASQFKMVNRLALGALNKDEGYRWEVIIRLI